MKKRSERPEFDAEDVVNMDLGSDDEDHDVDGQGEVTLVCFGF